MGYRALSYSYYLGRCPNNVSMKIRIRIEFETWALNIILWTVFLMLKRIDASLFVSINTEVFPPGGRPGWCVCSGNRCSSRIWDCLIKAGIDCKGSGCLILQNYSWSWSLRCSVDSGLHRLHRFLLRGGHSCGPRRLDGCVRLLWRRGQTWPRCLSCIVPPASSAAKQFTQVRHAHGAELCALAKRKFWFSRRAEMLICFDLYIVCRIWWNHLSTKATEC